MGKNESRSPRTRFKTQKKPSKYTRLNLNIKEMLFPKNISSINLIIFDTYIINEIIAKHISYIANIPLKFFQGYIIITWTNIAISEKIMINIQIDNGTI